MKFFFKKKKTLPNKHVFFIIASPRSGTTWMSKMLNAHPNILCVERRLFGDYADFVLDEGINEPRLRVTLDKYVKSLLLHHGLPDKEFGNILTGITNTIQQIERNTTGKQTLVDKITPYLNTSGKVIRSITHYFPKAKLIYLIRDGRDVLTSGVFHWFNKQNINDTLSGFEKKRRNIFVNNSDEQLDRFFQDKEIKQWAKEWAQPLDTISIAQKNHEVLLLHYENLLLDQKKSLQQCFNFMNEMVNTSIIQYCVEVSSFQKMTVNRKQGEEKADAHIRKGIAGDWKNYFTKRDGELFIKYAGKQLIEYNYEINEDWINQLPTSLSSGLM